MKARSCMSEEFMCIEVDESIKKAAIIMKNNNIGAVLVIKNSKLVGILTDRDIAIRGVAEGKINASCGDIMSSEVKSISKEDDIDKVVEYMSKYQIRRIPVTEGGRVIGLISVGDITDSEFSKELIGGDNLENS